MTPQFLSEKISRHLSSLAPGFEGHWVYARSQCPRQPGDEQMKIFCFNESYCKDEVIPAWQAEDVLRNWTEITVKVPTLIMSWHEKISWLLVSYPDTAYQKIEEYLWTIFK
jgi:hypothetical protein